MKFIEQKAVDLEVARAHLSAREGKLASSRNLVECCFGADCKGLKKEFFTGYSPELEGT